MDWVPALENQIRGPSVTIWSSPPRLNRSIPDRRSFPRNHVNTLPGFWYLTRFQCNTRVFQDGIEMSCGGLGTSYSQEAMKDRIIVILYQHIFPRVCWACMLARRSRTGWSTPLLNTFKATSVIISFWNPHMAPPPVWLGFVFKFFKDHIFKPPWPNYQEEMHVRLDRPA